MKTLIALLTDIQTVLTEYQSSACPKVRVRFLEMIEQYDDEAEKRGFARPLDFGERANCAYDEDFQRMCLRIQGNRS